MFNKPRKRDYRQRAHCNPLSDTGFSHPRTPLCVDWNKHITLVSSVSGAHATLYLNTKENPIEYPKEEIPEFVMPYNGGFVLDIGCGYGGLLVTLGPMLQENLIVGIEIREQVANYVGKRLLALKKGGSMQIQATEIENQTPSLVPRYAYDNVTVFRSNAMKYLMRYFQKQSCAKLFFCFPDPQFKKGKWRRRAVSTGLMSTYAYLLRSGGRIYFVTDVEELFKHMRDACESSQAFERIAISEQSLGYFASDITGSQTVLEARVTDGYSRGCKEDDKHEYCDNYHRLMHHSTEEGCKVRRNGGYMYSGVYQRV